MFYSWILPTISCLAFVPFLCLPTFSSPALPQCFHFPSLNLSKELCRDQTFSKRRRLCSKPACSWKLHDGLWHRWLMAALSGHYNPHACRTLENMFVGEELKVWEIERVFFYSYKTWFACMMCLFLPYRPFSSVFSHPAISSGGGCLFVTDTL